MEPEDIKVGDCYPVLAHVGYTNKKGNYGITINWGDGLMETRQLTPADACAMFSIYETKPKHDPCRLFKKGDKATPRMVNGRKPVCGIDGVAVKLKANSVELIVESNEGERQNGTVDIKFPCGTIGQIDPVYLELVAPEEELEPYSVETCQYGYTVNKGELILSTYNDETHPHAKEAAEAERDRLNAEYRKGKE